MRVVLGLQRRRIRQPEKKSRVRRIVISQQRMLSRHLDLVAHARNVGRHDRNIRPVASVLANKIPRRTLPALLHARAVHLQV